VLLGAVHVLMLSPAEICASQCRNFQHLESGSILKSGRIILSQGARYIPVLSSAILLSLFFLLIVLLLLLHLHHLVCHNIDRPDLALGTLQQSTFSMALRVGRLH
jgi:hypothetical protein